MIRYRLQEGLADNLTERLRPIEVRSDAGEVIGIVDRGSIPGAERAATFRFTPVDGEPTTLGVDVHGLKGKLSRLIRPRYLIAQGARTGALADKPGENLLYFALSGTVDGHALTAREDWDGAVHVTVDGTKIARIESRSVLEQTQVEIDVQTIPADILFGTIVLLVFMIRLYKDEAGLIEALFDD